LGATFAASGIAQQYNKKCLVIERRAQAGYEFFGALDFTVEETEIYAHFKSCHILFCTDLVSVQNTDNQFACVTHGVQGFYTYYAKKVIDTRSNAEMSLSKTYNLLIDSKEIPGIHAENG
jgi:UDP-galactopyranose mutase